MLIETYTDQLKRLAAEERVDLLDAVRHARVSRATYYRTIEGNQPLQQATALKIAAAIKELTAR